MALLLLFFLFLLPSGQKEKTYLVTKVLDGDTIVLQGGEVVRYAGLDAPELDAKEGPEFFAREALSFNKRLVFLKKVRLEFDKELRDAHGRLLAYVFVNDTFVNAELIRLGYARAAPKPPNEKYKDLFLQLQKKAMEEKIGLWQKEKEDTEAFYIGNKSSRVFHRPSCPYGQKISGRNRIIFRSRKDAIDIGYTPCRQCRP